MYCLALWVKVCLTFTPRPVIIFIEWAITIAVPVCYRLNHRPLSVPISRLSPEIIKVRFSNTNTEDAETTSLGREFQALTTLLVKKLYLTSRDSNLKASYYDCWWHQYC